MVACLLDAGADPLLHTDTKNTALHFAFALNRDAIISQLISWCGMHIMDMQNLSGQFPMELAHSGDEDAVRFANIVEQMMPQQRTSVVEECRKDRVDSCQRLLENKADVNARDKRGRTGLIMAVQNDNICMAKMLLKCKADPNCHTNKKKNTALHFAFRIGNRRMIELLLRHKASTRKKNSLGKTPPDVAKTAYLRNRYSNYKWK